MYLKSAARVLALSALILATITSAEIVGEEDKSTSSKYSRKSLTIKNVEVTDYWPEVAGDLTRVSWSHATNSRLELDEALRGIEHCI